MKYRQHKGSLQDSLTTAVEMPCTVEAIARQASIELGRGVSVSEISVEPYGYDHRIGWDTYVVKIHGYGVLGFTDGPVMESGYYWVRLMGEEPEVVKVDGSRMIFSGEEYFCEFEDGKWFHFGVEVEVVRMVGPLSPPDEFIDTKQG